MTDRSNKIMLNGVHIGYLDTAVKEWHPERAPKTWEKPGKKAMAASTKQPQKQKVKVEEVPQEQRFDEADTKYQQVMAELDRKYDEAIGRKD